MSALGIANANFLFVVFVYAAAAVTSSSSGTADVAGVTCVPKERNALLAFKQSITNDQEGLLSSWKADSPECCRWGGVRCSNLTGHVVELHLGGDGIPGSGGLTGEISHSLLSLKHLKYLDLSMNSLQGQTGMIPVFLGSLSNLRYLDLSGIPFYGAVPPHLGNLSKLQHLDLSGFAGMQHRYSNDISWLRRLPLLEYLDMTTVDLGAVANWPYVVNMLSSLRVLSLAVCSLTSANQSLPRLNLTNLDELDLSGNIFHHPVASSWVWNLTSLRRLSLGDTALYGELPTALGNMVSLEVLDVGWNNNNLNMTNANLKNLCNLVALYFSGSLSYGNITEIIERLPQCSSPKLQELYLRSNHLVGFLPNSLGHLTSLIQLDLWSNKITGPLPASIGQLTNLYTLDLRYNAFDGVLTEEHLGGLASLKYMYLSNNPQLKIVVGSQWLPTFRLQEAYFASCQLGPQFPAWLKGQVDIHVLDISSTGISSRLPDWFCTTFSNVTFLQMSNNQITGGLPTNMDIMSLGALYASSNRLTGQIPPLPRSLSTLDVSRNSLSGPLPSNFGVSKQITLISLYSNYFSGHIPKSFCELNLWGLDLANNLLEGEIPECLNMTGMSYLLLGNNSFSGKFPQIIRRCTSLSFLDLSWNSFSGTLPTWIGSCSSLQFLRLNHNMFHGHIPDNMTSLSKLYHLNLASNWISGPIPQTLSNLTFMTSMYVLPGATVPAGFQNIVGELLIDTKKQQLHYHGEVILEILSVDLSSNYLTGEIPEGLTSLDGLVNLNLSRNQLSGAIPYKIGAMQALESLDLSNNNLSAEIPSSISNLTYLSILDLSNNNLIGTIPSGRQLDTLYMTNPSMYDGNIGLCGPPLRRNCPSNDNSEHGDENHSEPMFLYFGLGTGYALGLWVTFCALLFRKAWRTAYFLLLDKFYDKIYVFVAITWRRFTRKT